MVDARFFAAYSASLPVVPAARQEQAFEQSHSRNKEQAAMKSSVIDWTRMAALLFAVLVLSASSAGAAEPSAGHSEQIAAALQPFVDGQTLAGAVALVRPLPNLGAAGPGAGAPGRRLGKVARRIAED